jgi:hypothetical protein
MAGEQGVLERKDQRPDAIFNRVGVHLNTAVGQKQHKANRMELDITQLFAEAGFG